MDELTQGIDWGTQVPSLSVTYCFLPAGDPLYTPAGFVTPQAWTAYDMQQFELGFALFETFTNLDFVETSDPANADLILVSYAGGGSSTLGAFSPPGTFGAGMGAFNTNGIGWDGPGGGLEQGGYGFVTVLHETGHGLGLAHPHDAGGTSTIFPGVGRPGDSGAYDLNQGVFTMMSYNDGWSTGPNGGPHGLDYGYEGTPMAIDIAVLQQKYGVNDSYHTGNDVYALPTRNASGTFYSCIWDAGGNDTISASGSSLDSIIDLNDATLAVEPGGGGFVSHASGINGGYTIAHGAVIENAVGGSGRDLLVGNEFANTLSGGSGNDKLIGGGGADRIDGGKGADFVFGLAGDDTLYGQSGNDLMKAGPGADVYAISDHDGFDLILGFNSGSDLLDLTPVDSVSGFDDLVLIDTGSGVLVSYGSGSFIMPDTSFTSVGADDFHFA